MEFLLRTRTETVGNRRVAIHEMTESEIVWLKSQRWGALMLGVALGVVATFLYFVTTIGAICGN